MSSFFRQTAVIARRDFLAVVFTPTFLLFLLAPFFMIGFGTLGGSGASQMMSSATKVSKIAAITTPADARYVKAADARLRNLFIGDSAPPELLLVPSHGKNDASVARGLLASKTVDHIAVLYGPLAAPKIVHDGQGLRSSDYLAQLAEQAERDRESGRDLAASVSKPTVSALPVKQSSLRGQKLAGYSAIFLLGFLTLFLSGQAVGMLAEEKSNKVIEVIAAAVSLEAVFLGKLIGMFGVAMLFIAFWGGLAGLAILASGDAFPAMLSPAVGLPAFLILCGLYFAMAYMLLGAVFLAVGSLASTMREIQMLSLPVTVFQISMLGLAVTANGSEGSRLQLIAEIVPFSSPFAMAGRSATDPALWPHFLALGWQLLWVAIIIWLGARLFRIGVLKAGLGPGARIMQWLSGRQKAH